MQDDHSHHPFIGRTPFFACQADMRFSYCLYVPPSYYDGSDRQYTLLTIVHGSLRTGEGYRDAFAGFADEHHCVVLAPLFPVGILSPDDQHSYKYICHEALRYDDVLHAMLAEVRGRFPRLRDGMLLHGFSGGGQFAHRYLFMHPERLLAVSIGAPGTVSLLNPDRDWWPGIRDFAKRTGKPLDAAAMERVQVQLIIGSEDTESWDVIVSPESPTWAPGANDAGSNRRERLAALGASLRSHGVPVVLETVPGIAHEGMRVLDGVCAFFSSVLGDSARQG